ncbi:8032_t:CDS:2 [Cetraspora pellucida]|uniref:8032_t:CDS:1 n=1 Tax=Cetraspora pellucida TaxID=1433469 RepID=A0A9N9DPZ6_9GLOM|nr:8032_t:CDS:2 [Cetraspora pellucida]
MANMYKVIHKKLFLCKLRPSYDILRKSVCTSSCGVCFLYSLEEIIYGQAQQYKSNAINIQVVCIPVLEETLLEK